MYNNINNINNITMHEYYVGLFEEKIRDQEVFISTTEQLDQSHINYLHELKSTLDILKKCKNESPVAYVAEHTDHRVNGDDWSEVSYIIIFMGCEDCCRAIHQWKYKNNRGFNRINYLSYSLGLLKNNSSVKFVNQKIIQYPARSKSAHDSDEMIMDSAWLD